MLLSELMPRTASAAPVPCPAGQQCVCFGTPQSVPGLNGPPQWWSPAAGEIQRTWLDDPRWNGAARVTHPRDNLTLPEANVRGVANNTHLYLTFQALIDGLLPTDPDVQNKNLDAVLVGLLYESRGDAEIVRLQI
jgi:hypothetical protein